MVFIRTEACAVYQALTAEVASVLKHSLDLATRRGHAQVTPLHVAAIFISSSSASSDLLRRACLKSQPHRPAFHRPLDFRALELCFSVALNRLPVATSPSGARLPSPSSLSNSLIAAIKRAQANQRRGCIELEQKQQPLLAIKVGVEKLMLSILDDPSVSRVMMEAGFSSRCVKSHLEEEVYALSQYSPSLFNSGKDITNCGFRPSLSEDLRMVMETMLRKKGSTNTVVVGDSGSVLEGLVAELMRRLGRSEIPDELRHCRFLNLQLSCSHLRLARKADVDAKVSDLRRTINSLASGRNGIIVYAGDLSWAVVDEARAECELSFDPMEHMVAAMGRLLSEFNRSSAENRVWLLATASYGTYRKCQRRQPSLEILWGLQAVVVPSGWLGLGLQASSSLDSRASTISQLPIDSEILRAKEEEKIICCNECVFNFGKETPVFKPETPCCLQLQLQANPERNRKEALQELSRKWNKIRQSLHSEHTLSCSPFFNRSLIDKSCTKTLPHSWRHWPSKSFVKPHSESFSTPIQTLNLEFSSTEVDERNKTANSSEASFDSLTMSTDQQQVKSTVALSSSPFFSDSATSKEQTRLLMSDPINLQHQLQEEIPWQSNNIPSITKALHDCSTGDKVMALLIQGSDYIAKRRLALVMARSLFGSTDKLIQIKQSDSCCKTVMAAIRRAQKCIVLVEDIDRMSDHFIKPFTDALKVGSFKGALGGEEVCLANAIFMLTTSHATKFKNDDDIRSAAMMKLWAEDDASLSSDSKRKSENDLERSSKRLRTEEHRFDLNFEPYVNIEEVHGVLSDLRQEETECISFHLPQELLKTSVQLTLNAEAAQYKELKVNLLTKLHRAFEEMQNGKDRKGHLVVDPEVAEELMQASGFFLESFYEKWVREVIRANLPTAQGGGNVRLSLQGKVRDSKELGFMASMLPNSRIIQRGWQ